MKLSIVATLYRSAAYVEEFCQRASTVAHQLVGEDYEIVLVNDGSPDDSLQRAIRLCESDPHLEVVDLSRNFGHEKAMVTGLARAQGDHVFLIDSDLEEEPEWLLPFRAEMDNEGCDVVYGVQETRKGSAVERYTGQWFYRLHRLITGMALPPNVTTARLMTRRYLDALLRHGERELYLEGLFHLTGFEQKSYLVRKHHASPTTYTFRHKMAMVVNSITSFSNAPLIGIFYLGAVLSVTAGAYSVYLMVKWLFTDRPVSGWTSVMSSIWLLGGLIIFFIGVVGIYLSKIYSETKARPRTIVKQVYGKKAD